VLAQSVDVEQRAILVEYDPRRMTAEESTQEINRALNEGWQVTAAHPMGGGGGHHDNPRYVSLVILSREIKDATS
jgi:hypothetical protein